MKDSAKVRHLSFAQKIKAMNVLANRLHLFIYSRGDVESFEMLFAVRMDMEDNAIS